MSYLFSKRGDRENALNYRPISETSTDYKILKKTIRKQINYCRGGPTNARGSVGSEERGHV